jgi:hypothetical protein
VTQGSRPRIGMDPCALGHPCMEALRKRYDVVSMDGLPDLVLSARASFFDPSWWDDPRLVEAALRRVRVPRGGKRRREPVQAALRVQSKLPAAGLP